MSRASALHRHGHPPDAGVAAGAVGGHLHQLVDAHRMHPGARRVLLERDPDDGAYWLILCKRHPKFGPSAGPGSVVRTPSLREARELVRLRYGRPADQRTARDVELVFLIDHMLPRGAP